METSDEKSFSLIVPAFNEEKRLHNELPHVLEYLGRNFHNFEVIYVDDGSSDHTYQTLLDMRRKFPEIRVLRLEKNEGKGKAVRTGLQDSCGNIILFSDADFSTPIEETSKLLDFLGKGFDIVIGSRAVEGSQIEIHQPRIREITGKVGNAVVQTLLLLPFRDTQCGFKLFRRAAVRKILPFLKIDGFAFDMEILAVAVSKGLKVAEVPVVWRNVLESKVRLHHTFQVLLDVLKIRYDQSMGKYS